MRREDVSRLAKQRGCKMTMQCCPECGSGEIDISQNLVEVEPDGIWKRFEIASGPTCVCRSCDATWNHN